jgi:Bacterial PH domain
MKPVYKQPSRGQEHEFEPQFGLPEKLPATEKILWQGQPLPALMARRVFHLGVLAVYFAVMLVWRVASQMHDGVAWNDALRGTLVLALLAGAALAMLGVMARLAAQTAVYTITDKRVVMRIGIVLTVTYNLPLRSIDAAHLLPLDQGRGEIALALRGDTRIAYLQLWPHARPWHLGKPQPMLRGLANAQAVSDLLVRAWTLANAVPAHAQSAAASPSAGVPSLATARGT